MNHQAKIWQVFVPDGSSFRALSNMADGLSINDVTKLLGYLPAQTRSFIGGIDSDISAIVFEVFTSNIVFVLAKASHARLDEKLVKEFLDGFDARAEYGIANVVDILNDAKTAKSFSIEFLNRVLGTKIESGQGEFFVEKLGIKLILQDGYLTDFVVPYGLGVWARYFKEINPDLFVSYSRESKRFRGDDLDGIIREMNAQFDALARLPHAFGNEFVELHRNKSGTINFLMLTVCHYDYPISQIEFEEINRGRYERLAMTKENETIYCLGNFIYLFGGNGELIKASRLG